MIHGERVTLRVLDLEADIERCYQWINDPEITQYLRILGPITRQVGSSLRSKSQSEGGESGFSHGTS